MPPKKVKQLTLTEIWKLIQEHNKLSKIEMPKGKDRTRPNLIKAIEKAGFSLNHEKKRIEKGQKRKTDPMKDAPKDPKKVVISKDKKPPLNTMKIKPKSSKPRNMKELREQVKKILKPVPARVKQFKEEGAKLKTLKEVRALRKKYRMAYRQEFSRLTDTIEEDEWFTNDKFDEIDDFFDSILDKGFDNAMEELKKAFEDKPAKPAKPTPPTPPKPPPVSKPTKGVKVSTKGKKNRMEQMKKNCEEMVKYSKIFLEGVDRNWSQAFLKQYESNLDIRLESVLSFKNFQKEYNILKNTCGLQEAKIYTKAYEVFTQKQDGVYIPKLKEKSKPKPKPSPKPSPSPKPKSTSLAQFQQRKLTMSDLKQWDFKEKYYDFEPPSMSKQETPRGTISGSDQYVKQLKIMNVLVLPRQIVQAKQNELVKEMKDKGIKPFELKLMMDPQFQKNTAKN